MSVPLEQATSLHDNGAKPDSLVDQTLTMERVQVALDKIDASQREVVELRFLSGLSLREVAQVLDKTVAAVKTLQHRGLASLRVSLLQES